MNNNPFIKPIAILVGIVIALYVVGKFFAPKEPPPATPPPIPAGPDGASKVSQASPPTGPAAKLGPKAVKMPTGLQYEDLVVGTGAEAKEGKTIDVKYAGTLTDGTPFDSGNYSLTLPGQVIRGWNEGIPGMKVGGKRKLVIPPDMAYGDVGSGEKIGPGATLVFEVELLKVD